MTDKQPKLLDLLADLTGQKPPFPAADLDGACRLLGDGGGLGWSQLNEVLLLLGYDRVPSGFFQYLVDQSVDYQSGSGIVSLEHLRESVCRFQILALLVFGNVRYAFKTFSKDPQLLGAYLEEMMPVSTERFLSRHSPVVALAEIPPDKTYLLGYLIEKELRKRLEHKPDDAEALVMERSRQEVVQRGRLNQEAYLTSDHLDVYVATSMRQRHEFLLVNRLTKMIFEHEMLRDLKLRWFDPTQAYCGDRIDKGLAEGLMLKRARCTVYFAQESETLGKDSELATTLAQGKPVIAYVPEGSAEEVDAILSDLSRAYPGHDEREIIIDQLRVFNPNLAWEDPEVRRWLEDPSAADVSDLRQRLNTEVYRKYEKTAQTLKEDHPLGIQVNLQNGVSNGVLVIRNVRDCAELVRRIVTQALEFDLEYLEKGSSRYILLRERISGCIFRVVTGDEMLTNAFWNFYLATEEEG